MPKILIVDDSDALRFEVRAILEAGGYEVVDGDCGSAGIRRAQENPDIQLIITDLNMPDMDGFAMCQHIRQMPQFASTPIFMLTTEASKDLKAAGKAAGVKLWIIKPVEGEKLLQVIRMVLPGS